MNALQQRHHPRQLHGVNRLARSELERRIARAAEDLHQARCQLRRAREAVLVAEQTLLARRLAWEEAAMRVAELADLVDTLQRDEDAAPGEDGAGTASRSM